VQHFGESLGWSSEVKAFPRCVVVDGDQVSKAAVWQCGEVGFAGHEAPHPADGVLDAALLPGRVGIAKEGVDRQAVQPMMAGELGAVVEGDGLTQLLRHGAEQPDEMAGDAIGSLRRPTSIGRSAMETRPSMKLAELPPFLPRQPRLLLPRGKYLRQR
jgi:hypothetical protein